MKTVWLFLFIGLLAGCATTGPPAGHAALVDAFAREAKPPSGVQAFEPSAEEKNTPSGAACGGEESLPRVQDARTKVVQTAQAFLGKKYVVLQDETYRNDCSGFVEAVYAQVGIDLMQAAQPGDNGVTAMFRYVKAHGQTFNKGWPIPGDLVFFRNTYPHTHNALTHIGIVESMDSDGTIYIIHHVSRGVVRYTMNLNHKNQTTNQQGKRVNDYIRARKGKQPAKLTSELFVTYASLLPVESVLLAQHEGFGSKGCPRN